MYDAYHRAMNNVLLKSLSWPRSKFIHLLLKSQPWPRSKLPHLRQCSVLLSNSEFLLSPNLCGSQETTMCRLSLLIRHRVNVLWRGMLEGMNISVMLRQRQDIKKSTVYSLKAKQREDGYGRSQGHQVARMGWVMAWPLMGQELKYQGCLDVNQPIAKNKCC